MNKIEALKACVWLESFVVDRANGIEFYEAIQKIRDLKTLIQSLPNDEPELQIEVKA